MTELHFQTIGEIAGRLRAGETSSRALTELMLDRIAKLDPVLNAFVTVTGDQARETADRADAELAAGRDRGPLHGIPVAIKDLFDTAGVRTTYGSNLYENHVPDRDATAVRLLREAGAVSLGKTGLHEFAYGNNSINPFFGAIGNPWAPDHDPGGSSGGSAAAVAAGMAYAALGSDTGCSIRQPAHCCGITGFKPSFGMVSKASAFPLVWTMDHVGPLTRSVGDAALVHGVLAGPDPEDPYTGLARIDRSGGDGIETLDGIRLGISRQWFFEGHADVVDTVEEALRTLAGKGATLVDLDIPDAEQASDAASTIFAEAYEIHRKTFAEHPEDYSADVGDKLARDQAISAADYVAAQHFRRGFIERVARQMESCDALAAPASLTSAKPIAVRPGDYGMLSVKNCWIFNLTGQPSISIPCGFTPAGLPVGLMLTGRIYEDAALLNLAAAVERNTDWRRHPAL